MRSSPSRSGRRALDLVVAALLPLAAAVAGVADVADAATPGECMDLVVIDTVADPGVGMPTGEALAVDVDQPPPGNAQSIGGDAQSRALSHAAVGPGRAVFLSDLEADPAAQGQDPNGNPGPGAVFRVDPAGTGLLLVASSDAFVDPIGLDWDFAGARLLVADLDADPSALGPDSRGFAGHGAVFAVDPASGSVTLVSDGTSFEGGAPPGVPSIFEDPVGVDTAPDGTIHVVDQLAQPLGSGTPVGAVFAVDPATGDVTTVAVSEAFRGLRDVAVEPGGTLLVLDRIAGGNGALFRVDPTLPADAAVVATFSDPAFVEPAGVAAWGNGRIFVVDTASASTPDAFGAVFEVDPSFPAVGGVSVVASEASFASLWSVALLEPMALDAATPASGTPGTSLTVVLEGGRFDADAAVDFGPGVVVGDVRQLDATRLEVELTIDAGAAPGPRDVRIANQDQTEAFHCDLFDVLPGCVPTLQIAPSLEVARTASGDLVVTWDASSDPCAASHAVWRSPIARPDVAGGSWPDDPDFTDVTALDGDGDATNARWTSAPTADRVEHFLVTARGPAGEPGPSGHYEP